MTIKQFFLTAALITTTLPAPAAEYFVSKQGNDANNGTTKQAAFLTIQKGVDALAPGDTLTIGRGEYFETVERDGLGSMDAQTTIRAELPGTVVLRGDVPIASSAFKKVAGYRYIYAADFDREVQGINELDTLTRMDIFPTLGELEFTPGTSHYDAQRKRLFISTSDLQPPDTHHYTVSVAEGSGLMLLNPRRITIDGITATGFQTSKLVRADPGHFTVWGILAEGARGCIVRNCVAYFNGGGIAVGSAVRGSKDGVENGWNLIEKCTAFANGSKFAPEGGNIISYSSNHDEIRDSYAYRGHQSGMRHYGAGIRGPAVLRNSIAWGNTMADVFLKGGQIEKYGLTENTITLGKLHSHNLKNSIIGTINQYNREPGDDTVYGLFSPFGNQQTMETRRDEWFADVENLDFRLQATSPLRGSGPNGTDRGPFPYQPNIFYLSAAGNDTNDGLSTQKPWKTLAFAMSRLRPGDTLYLEGGTYEAAGEFKITGNESQSTSIRGRGVEPVIVRGDFAVSGSKGLEFERLNFSGAITVRDSRDIRFNNCRFASQSTPITATSVENLKVTHGEFTGFEQAALRLEKSSNVWLSGNMYDNRTAPALQTDEASAVLYSDYNSYANPDAGWRIGQTATKLAELQETQDQYSVVRTPQYVADSGFPRLQNSGSFDAGGPAGTGIGFHREYRKTPMSVTAPTLHSVSDTTANLEWWTSIPAETEVAWGETPDTPNKFVFNKNTSQVTDGFSSLSLTGLKPGTKYYVRVLSAKPLEDDVAQYMTPASPKDALLTFEMTGTAPAGRVLHVAPDGDNENSGLSRAQAWRTVAHAGDVARAGDTILIAGGTYTETIRVRASGSPGKPITFKAAPGEKVVFDGDNRVIKTAFALAGKQHINLDGFYFQRFGDAGWKSVVDVRQCGNLLITRCFFNAAGAGTSGVQFRAVNSDNVTIRNCVFARAFHGMTLNDVANFNIENSIFLNNFINAFRNSGGEPKSIHVKNNLFVDSIPSKVKAQLFELSGIDQYVFANNAFYLRIPDEQRKPFLFYGTGPGRISIADYDKQAGTKNIVIADPDFPITRGKEPTDAAGKKLDFLGDWISTQDRLDFPHLFATNAELNTSKIGLQSDAFEDFHFDKTASQPAVAGN